MALAVVSYPELSAAGRRRIESIREQHDALYRDLIDAHFAFVFPAEGVPESVFVDHVRAHATAVAPFEFVLRCAILGDPDFEDHAHAFLVPDEGFSDMVRLYDRLYAGPLKGELRLDIPFIPHLAVANTPTPEACQTIVDSINAERFEIRGWIAKLDIIGFDGKRVWTIEQVGLSGPA
jgi:hypothetical protein